MNIHYLFALSRIPSNLEMELWFDSALIVFSVYSLIDALQGRRIGKIGRSMRRDCAYGKIGLQEAFEGHEHLPRAIGPTSSYCKAIQEAVVDSLKSKNKDEAMKILYNKFLVNEHKNEINK